MAKLSKRLKKAVQQVKATERYDLDVAVEKLLAFPSVKFDETVELSAHLGVDVRQSTQRVRGAVSLPHGSGRKVRILVFTENPEEAKNAGADYAGLDDWIEKVKGGWTDFDVAVATTSSMSQVKLLARTLGPRGLMPNPRNGTVTDDVPSAVKAVKAGRIDFKMDKGANVAVVVGKRSFGSDKLLENTKAAVESLLAARPENFKETYFKSLSLSSSMSPSVGLDIKSVSVSTPS